MSRVISSLLSAVLLLAIAGCGNSEKPATESQTPKVDNEQIEKNKKAMMDKMKDSPNGPPSAGPPAGDAK